MRGDYDGNGKADILWRNAVNNEGRIWLMNGPVRLLHTWLTAVPDTGTKS